MSAGRPGPVHSGPAPMTSPAPHRSPALVWLTGPLLFATAVAGTVIVTQGGARLFGWTVGSLVVVGLGWVLVSSLFPAEPDRTCPACGVEALVRADPLTTRGVRCTACGHDDPEASSFLIAEDEGPLEPAVLRERGRARGRIRRTVARRPPPLAESSRRSAS